MAFDTVALRGLAITIIGAGGDIAGNLIRSAAEWIETLEAQNALLAERLEDKNSSLRVEIAAKHAAYREITELEAEIARLRKGVEDYRAGDYPNPRTHRPHPCPHGCNHWQECDACNDAALAAILSPLPHSTTAQEA